MTFREWVLDKSSLLSGTLMQHLNSIASSHSTAGSDCTDAISLAINNYKREIAARTLPEEKKKLIVVQDGRVANSADGKVGGKVSVIIKEHDIDGYINSEMQGNINGGSISGGIGGKISGIIKK